MTGKEHNMTEPMVRIIVKIEFIKVCGETPQTTRGTRVLPDVKARANFSFIMGAIGV